MIYRYLTLTIIVLVILQSFPSSVVAKSILASASDISVSDRVGINAIQPQVTSACQITYKQANRYIQSKSVLLVDVRSEDSYRESTILGAVNIPLYALKTKSYLKGKHLLLFDDGSNPHKLVSECRKLISNYGMKISVLKGGIRQWNNSGKSKGILYKLTPDDYLASKNLGRWITIDATGGLEARKIFKDTPLVAATKIVSNDTSEITSAIKQGKDVVVLTDRGESTKQLADIQKVLDQPVYLLVGGVKGYGEFLNNRKRFLTRLKRGPVKAVQCVQ